VLQDNHPNYMKGARYRKTMAPIMGNGLFTSEGADWLKQRRLVQPVFSRKHIDSFAGPILGCIEQMLDEWRTRARNGQAIRLRDEITRLMLRVVLLISFGMDAEKEMDALMKADNQIHNEMNLAKAFLPFTLPRWTPTPGNLRFERGLRYFNEFTFRVIAERRKLADPGSDLLGILIRAVDGESGGQMDDEQLRDQLMTFIHTGHDTVTDSMVWMLILLARHPAAKEQVRREIAALAGGNPIAPEAIQQMHVFGRAYHETLRLYPSAWAFLRTAIEADTIGGYKIPAGRNVILSSYVTGRSPRYWEHPERFDPDRFLPERSEGRHRMAFFPFSAGPRLCIGQNLSFLEAPLIVSRILQTFELEIENADMIVPAPRISLRPKGDVPTRLRLLH